MLVTRLHKTEMLVSPVLVAVTVVRLHTEPPPEESCCTISHDLRVVSIPQQYYTEVLI